MPNYIDSIQPFNDLEIYNIKAKEINLDIIHPIGSVYMSTSSTEPALLFGGVWEQIKDIFLLAAGDTYTNGSTGGSTTVSHTHTLSHTHSQVAQTSGGPSNNTSTSTAISTAQMPSHNHGSGGGHTHVCGRHATTFAPGNEKAYKCIASPRSTKVDANNITYSENAGSHTHGAVGSGGGHTHTLSSHTHSTSATTTGGASNATTSEATVNNIPPYLAVYMWKRIE